MFRVKPLGAREAICTSTVDNQIRFWDSQEGSTVFFFPWSKWSAMIHLFDGHSNGLWNSATRLFLTENGQIFKRNPQNSNFANAFDVPTSDGFDFKTVLFERWQLNFD